MAGRPTRHTVRLSYAALLLSMPFSGCRSPQETFKRLKEIDYLKLEVGRLERAVAARDGRIAELERQVELLKDFGADRPADLFAPVKLEIASLSGGAEYDDKPGDDGVTVHLRLRDADGDTVKAPGRIKVEILDLTTIGSPRLLGNCEVNDPERLRRIWHGRFATDHFTLQCPFSEGVPLPDSRKVSVSAAFVDFLTGATLTAVKEVGISFPEP